MKKCDFDKMNSHLEASILVDCYVRRINEKLGFISRCSDSEHLRHVASFLDIADASITDYINDNLIDHE